MPTLTNNLTEQVCATGVRFDGRMLYVSLSDGRDIGIPPDKVEWLKWLANATPEQRAKWSVEPGGFAIYWEDLDDGIEVCRLLGAEPFA
jgi:hypothetical protein